LPLGNVDVFDEDETCAISYAHLPTPSSSTVVCLIQNRLLALIHRCLFLPPTLSETNRARSEIQFIELFHGLFPRLNAFTRPIDWLFEKTLSLPILPPSDREALLSAVSAALTKHNLLSPGSSAAAALDLLTSDEAVSTSLMAAAKIHDVRVLRYHVLPEALATLSARGGAADSLTADDARGPTLYEL